jgi:hypothetical protein
MVDEKSAGKAQGGLIASERNDEHRREYRDKPFRSDDDDGRFARAALCCSAVRDQAFPSID